MIDGNKSKTMEIIERHKKAWSVFFYGAIVFFSCCLFPLIKYAGGDSIEWINLIMFFAVFISLGDFLRYLNLYQGKLSLNLLSILVAMVGGLLCRYFIEYGEVSNMYNFTVVNVAAFVIAAILLILVGFGTYDLFKQNRC